MWFGNKSIEEAAGIAGHRSEDGVQINFNGPHLFWTESSTEFLLICYIGYLMTISVANMSYLFV
jgi:hypothetical protein